ncbi:MAG: hypothetical protein AAGC54_09445, partial [Cyanobacteria bacterium P01_F01_bin.4]
FCVSRSCADLYAPLKAFSSRLKEIPKTAIPATFDFRGFFNVFRLCDDPERVFIGHLVRTPHYLGIQ